MELERSDVRSLVEAALPNHHFSFDPKAKNSAVLRVRYGTDRPNQIYLAVNYEKDEREAGKLEASRWISFEGVGKARESFKSGFEKELDDLFHQVKEENQKVGAAQTIRDYSVGKHVSESQAIAAIEKITASRDKGSLTSLGEALKQPNIRVSLRIVEALSVIGDANSIEAMTEFSENKIPEVRRHTIEAVKKIGGRKAAAWLFTLSTGHNDSQVREAASNALKEVEGRLALAN